MVALNVQCSMFNGESFLQLPRRVVVATAAAAIRAALVVATLGDVLLTRSSGSGLRVNLLPTHLVGELAAELRGCLTIAAVVRVSAGRHPYLRRLSV